MTSSQSSELPHLDFNFALYEELLDHLPTTWNTPPPTKETSIPPKTFLRKKMTETRELMVLDQILSAHRVICEVFVVLEDFISSSSNSHSNNSCKRPPPSSDATTTQSASIVPNSNYGAKAVRNVIHSSPLYQTLIQRYEACNEVTKAIESSNDDGDESSWVCLKKGAAPGEGTFYREEKSLGTHSFKMIGTVKQSVFRLVAVLLELDLYTEWFPFCGASDEVASLTRFAKIARFVVKCPWPIANREVLLTGYGIDALAEHKKIIICTKSVEEGSIMANGEPAPPVGKGNVRAFIHRGGFVLRVLSPTTTKVGFMMNIDPMIANIPYWMLNWISGKVIWVLLWQLESAAGYGEKSKYAKRQQEKAELYKYIQARANAAGVLDK